MRNPNHGARPVTESSTRVSGLQTLNQIVAERIYDQKSVKGTIFKRRLRSPDLLGVVLPESQRKTMSQSSCRSITPTVNREAAAKSGGE